MKTLADITTLDSLYYYLKHSIRSLQIIHARGDSHGALYPHTLSIDPPYDLLEDSVDTMYAAPEIALGLAVVEKYKPEEAVRLWNKESSAMRWLEQWIPIVAEAYTPNALQKLIGTPLPEQQSDIWSLGISYLCIFDSLYKKETSFPEKELFFEAISGMLRLRGRVLPSVEPAVPAEIVEPALPVETAALRPGRLNGSLAAGETPAVAHHSGRLMLTEPIRRGERNKTRRNPHN
jgi:hypothetical protein